MTLQVYNTLTRKREPFRTVEEGKVTMYVCGPTVYKPSHVGHMVGPVIFDTVKRYLTYLGYEVTFVVNITDVDDKLIKRSAELGTTVKDLAEQMTADYLDCLRKLNVIGIDVMPKATEHIGDMIEIISGLIDKGYAYPSEGDVYFDVSKDEDYGKLCNRDPEQLEAGTRIEVSERKRNPGDFALWKGAKPGEPQWESPWGPGRPGWHIECSAMSQKILGTTIDIHGGGLDLQFPHHENELAQSESFTGQPFAKYWMHNGLMKMGQSKMAGSVGNVVNVVELLENHSAETVRFLLLSTHYRSPIDYNEERLAEVKRSLDGFYRFFERYERITGKSFFEVQAPTTQKESEANRSNENELWSESRQTFIGYLNDDFNTGGGVAVLYELLNKLNRFADDKKVESNKDEQTLATWEQGAELLRELSQILGIFRNAPESKAGGKDELVAGLMQLLVDLRADARKSKNFAVSDQIRDRLNELNVVLEDRADGTGWRIE